MSHFSHKSQIVSLNARRAQGEVSRLSGYAIIPSSRLWVALSYFMANGIERRKIEDSTRLVIGDEFLLVDGEPEKATTSGRGDLRVSRENFIRSLDKLEQNGPNLVTLWFDDSSLKIVNGLGSFKLPKFDAKTRRSI